MAGKVPYNASRIGELLDSAAREVIRGGKPSINTETDLPTAARDGFEFHAGQMQMMNSEARTIIAVAGSQSGKTIAQPWWMRREIQRMGPGEYAAIGATYPLMESKLIPEYRNMFERTWKLGKYTGTQPAKIILTPEGEEKLFGKTQKTQTTIFFIMGSEPSRLESMTLKGAATDEWAMMEVPLASYEALMRRLLRYEARCLMTTTPYEHNPWFEDQLHRPALLETSAALEKGEKPKQFELVRFKTLDNPAMPRSVVDQAKAQMPDWRFRMMYEGEFTRPAGSIFDCYDPDVHEVSIADIEFPFPASWIVYAGLDFGAVNTAAFLLAVDPETSIGYVCGSYHAGDASAKDHGLRIASKIARVGGRPGLWVGGAPSEDQWRREFTLAGYPVMRPGVKEVDVGIQRFHRALKLRQLLFIKELAAEVIKEVKSYSHELDRFGRTTGRIADKNTYHRLDGGRYIVSTVMPGEASIIPVVHGRFDPSRF